MDHSWLVELTDSAIRSVVGAGAYVRGLGYAESEMVRELTLGGGGTLLATVDGSGRRPYSTLVSPNTLGHGERFAGRCTCPVLVNCKHVAAVVLTARAQQSAPDLASGSPDDAWERSVARIIESASGQDETGVPLGLQVQLVRRETVAPRWYANPGQSTPVRRLGLQPVTPGRSGRWIRTGVSWRDLEYGHLRTTPRPAHRAALRELHLAATARGGYSYYPAGQQQLHLDDFGPSVWRLLAQLVDAGVALVAASPNAGPVRLASAPATLALDLRRPEPDADADLLVTVTVDGQPVLPASVRLVGEPAHGLFVEDDDGGLVLAALDRPASPQVARLLAGGGRLPVPAGDLDRFLHGYYPALRQVINVMSSDESVDLPRIEPPRLALTVTYRPQHRVALRWEFAYRTGDTEARVPLCGGAADTTVVRDGPAERALLDRFEFPDAGLPQLVSDATEGAGPVDVELVGLDTAAFTERVLPALQARDDVQVTVVGTPADYRLADSAPLVQVSASDAADGSDWFDLAVTVSVDGEDIPFDQLFVALALGESHLLLDSGTYLSIERPELEQLRRLIEEARALQDRESDGLRISTYQAGLWEELVSLGVVRSQSERWQRTVQALLDLDQLTTPPVPPSGLEAELRPYQLDGYQWLGTLYGLGLGGVLADDMGLGKTLQTLAMICRAHELDQASDPFLVVAPTSVVQNWVREIDRFAPGLKVVSVTETEARRGTPLPVHVAGADVVVTSYALFRIEFDAYAALPWSGLVLDEAQFVKNHQSKAHQCARRLQAPFKLAITGTPLENNLMELWSLLSIVAPGLFPNPDRFAELFAKPIERGGDHEQLATLRRRIRPLMRRRTKEEVASELPPKQEQVLHVELNPKHRRIYNTHLQRERQKVLGLIDDMDRNRFTIFRSLTLLRQLSLDASLVDDEYAGVRSSKADAFLEQLRSVVDEGHRALVFSQFTGFLRAVRDRLDAEGITHCYLDGRTRNRASRIEEFKTGDAPVFLISLKAGGFGLNLTEADYCFVLDPWWNPAVEAQAVDRAHRIGQDKTVMVYRLVATGTIEEKVMELKARKMDLFSRVMDGDALASAPLTADDIRGLLSA